MLGLALIFKVQKFKFPSYIHQHYNILFIMKMLMNSVQRSRYFMRFAVQIFVNPCLIYHSHLWPLCESSELHEAKRWSHTGWRALTGLSEALKKNILIYQFHTSDLMIKPSSTPFPTHAVYTHLHKHERMHTETWYTHTSLPRKAHTLVIPAL